MMVIPEPTGSQQTPAPLQLFPVNLKGLASAIDIEHASRQPNNNTSFATNLIVMNGEGFEVFSNKYP
eukprot:m.216195 g.216195  ORF g.216195 m.216195 type:complete len:67 (+) comp33204_c2_seq1:1881-2081(+)